MKMKCRFLAFTVTPSAYEPYMNHIGKFINAVFFCWCLTFLRFAHDQDKTTLLLLRPNRIKLRATEEVKTTRRGRDTCGERRWRTEHLKQSCRGKKCSGEEEMKGAWRERERERERGSAGGGRYNEVLWVSGGRSHSACQANTAWLCTDGGMLGYQLSSLSNQEVDGL